MKLGNKISVDTALYSSVNSITSDLVGTLVWGTINGKVCHPVLSLIFFINISVRDKTNLQVL